MTKTQETEEEISGLQGSTEEGTRLVDRIPAVRLLLVDLAGILYGISMQKYALRNALSSDTGVQGYFEIAGCMGAFLCISLAVRGFNRRFAPSITSTCFALYALFALASSWRSFNPALSFVKGVLLIAGLAFVRLLGQAGSGQRFFRALYWTYLTTLGVGLLLGVTIPAKFPLFMVDEYLGRSKLSLFATHPGVLAETCAMLILIAPLLRYKPHWSSVCLLFVVNVLAGEKAATGVLVLALLMRFVGHFDRRNVWRTFVLVGAPMLSVLLAIDFYALSTVDIGRKLDATAIRVYGNQTAVEAGSLDGRTEVWKAAGGLLSKSELLGYGVGGARDALIHAVWWSGQAHNSYLDAALDSGMPGGFFFMVSIAGVIVACLRSRSELRVGALAFLGYVLVNALIGSILNTPVNFGTLCVFWIYYLTKEDSTMPEPTGFVRQASVSPASAIVQSHSRRLPPEFGMWSLGPSATNPTAVNVCGCFSPSPRPICRLTNAHNFYSLIMPIAVALMKLVRLERQIPCIACQLFHDFARFAFLSFN